MSNEKLAEALRSLRLKFTSGNDVPVPEARITRAEWEAIEQAYAALRPAWLFKRQQELIANGMKIEQSRIHAETELNSWIARMMFVPPNYRYTDAPQSKSSG